MRNLFLAPFRLCVGWGISPRILPLIAVFSLVLLRLTIGWHFYSEGIVKVESGNWTATPFFANARGPLRDTYRQMVWDIDGQYRLDEKALMTTWALHRDRAIEHFGFDDEQIDQAYANYKKAVEQYKWVRSENAADIEEFELGRGRVRSLATDEVERSIRRGVRSLGGQGDTIVKEWEAKGKPILAKIDKIWWNYEADQNRVATESQLADNGSLEIVRPRTWIIDTSVIDRLLPYFDVAVGLCLLLGLFTPLAALAAAGFLGSVVLSQYPPATGPSSSMYQLIESMACLVLAGTGAGRFAGIDYFLHLLVRRRGANIRVTDR